MSLSASDFPGYVDAAIAAHDALIDVYGGSYGIRDRALLESAIASAFQTYDGVEIYPDPREKAACCAFRIASNHPFVDGNKRCAAGMMHLLLSEGGYELDVDDDTLANTFEALAAGTISYNQLELFSKTFAVEPGSSEQSASRELGD